MIVKQNGLIGFETIGLFERFDKISKIRITVVRFTM